MAFKKTYTAKNGTTGEYWKITDILTNDLTKKSTIVIELFKNQSYRQNQGTEAQSIHRIVIKKTGSEYPFNDENLDTGDMLSTAYQVVENAEVNGEGNKELKHNVEIVEPRVYKDIDTGLEIPESKVYKKFFKDAEHI